MIEKRLQELGLILPPTRPSSGNYVDTVKAGSFVYVSGRGPRAADGRVIAGKVGRDVTTDEAYAHARTIGLMLVAALKGELGDLDRVRRIVKVLGFVNAVPEFGEHPKVINGCSDLFIEVFGEKGRHSRSAIGVGSLPNNMTVEIEMMAEITD